MTDEMIARAKRNQRMKWSYVTGLIAGILIFAVGITDTPLGRTSPLQAAVGAIMILWNIYNLWSTRKKPDQPEA